MEIVALTLGSLLVGVLATILVTRHFFQKSVAKHLTPYIQHALPLLTGIDPEVRKALKVFYQDTEVDDIFQLQFVIVNEGERAIRNCIEPLSLPLPLGVQVLDASILHVHPQGRAVGVKVLTSGSTSRIQFPFSLLNKGEGFVAKILLKGVVSRKDLRFEIVVDDLPPVIEPQVWQIGFAEEAHTFDVPTFILGMILLLVGAASIYVMVMLRAVRPELFPFPWSQFQPSWLETPAMVLFGPASVLFVLLAILAIVSAVFGTLPKRRPPLPVPSHLRHRGIWVTAKSDVHEIVSGIEIAHQLKQRDQSRS